MILYLDIISINPQFMARHVQLTAVPLKLCLIKYEIDIIVYNFEK